MPVQGAGNEVGIYKLLLAHMFLNRDIEAFSQALTNKFSVSSIEWLMLGVVAETTEAGGIKVTDLAVRFGVKSTYITAVLNNLRAKQYVQTRLDGHDARVRLTVISVRGTKRLARVEQYAQQELSNRLGRTVSAAELVQYIDVLKRLARNY